MSKHVGKLFVTLSFSLIVGLGLSACSTQADQIINTQTRVLTQDPNNVSALIERGSAFRDKNEIAPALTDLNKAIELAPESARAYHERGRTHLRSNQYENALKDFEKALSLNPELAEAYAYRGQTRVLLQSNFEQALQDFDTALGKGVRNSSLYRYRALAFFRLQQKDKALENYLLAAEVEPESVEALNEALDIGLNDYRLYLKRGQAYNLKKDYRDAIPDFSKVLELSPQNTAAYEGRSDARYATGQCSLAQEDLRAACRIDGRSLCDAIHLSCGVSASASPFTDKP